MASSELDPNFLIPQGTQVVLRRDLPVFKEAGSIKKLGSVGWIVEAPLTNDRPYTIAFADDRQVKARKDDLKIRRADAPEDLLPHPEISAFEAHLIYRVRVGSRAYGLDDASSDTDERGVFLPPAEWHWSLQPLKEQLEFKRAADGTILDHNQPADADDHCWWELEKFIRLALKANPNVLEVLYVPEPHVLFMNDMGERLRALRGAFLSRYIYQTYSGYALSQFRKMRKSAERGVAPKPKHATHLLRLLYSGIQALRTGEIMVDVGEHRKELLDVKQGRTEFEAVYQRALQLDAEFQSAFDASSLPERPNVEAIDRFLIEARRSQVL